MVREPPGFPQRIRGDRNVVLVHSAPVRAGEQGFPILLSGTMDFDPCDNELTSCFSILSLGYQIQTRLD
jgi:hypothetical protein